VRGSRRTPTFQGARQPGREHPRPLSSQLPGTLPTADDHSHEVPKPLPAACPRSPDGSEPRLRRAPGPIRPRPRQSVRPFPPLHHAGVHQEKAAPVLAATWAPTVAQPAGGAKKNLAARSPLPPDQQVQGSSLLRSLAGLQPAGPEGLPLLELVAEPTTAPIPLQHARTPTARFPARASCSPSGLEASRARAGPCHTRALAVLCPAAERGLRPTQVVAPKRFAAGEEKRRKSRMQGRDAG